MSENNDLITVCDRCLAASCWQGEFMCQEAQSAGITQMTRTQLREIDREHEDYWLTDYELSLGLKRWQIFELRTD